MSETKAIHIDYKLAYERQKQARQLAEDIVENRSRELFEQNQLLEDAFNQLKSQKAKLLHQDKLASIGQLAAGVAHEINNPIGYVKSNLHMLARYSSNIQEMFSAFQSLLGTLHHQLQQQDNPVIHQQLEQLRQLQEKLDIDYIIPDLTALTQESIIGADRVEEIVKSLKSFARWEKGSTQDYNLNDCIHETLKLTWNEIKYKCNLDLQLQEVPLLHGNPGEINQVLLNLLVNATQAIDGNGNITITTSHNDKNVILTVSDSGKGIHKEHLNQIFDPFFTTKEAGQGTGLGLSITHGIIEKHKGSIEVASQPGKGTTFTIHLPVNVDDNQRETE